MQEWSDAWAPILDALLDSTEPLALHQVATAVDRSQATTLRHLQAMVDAGWVQRTGDRKTARYTPNEHIVVRWTGQVGTFSERRPMHQTWTAEGPVDWRFPLLQRIPDGPARQTLGRFLSLALAQGLLTPWTRRIMEGAPKRQDRWRQFVDRLQEGRGSGIEILVYGSCARGDARPESDVDVLILGPEEHRGDEGPSFIQELGFHELAYDINIGAPRALSLLIEDRDGWEMLQEGFRSRVLSEALTVYSTTGRLHTEADG